MNTTAPKPFCFVLMPFSKDFDDVYKLCIKEACHTAGTYCERVDEQVFDGGILERIYNQIAKADIIIADMTGRNPNVFYEVGYAHALGKRVVLLTKASDDIPFDLKHYPHIVYEKGLADLREQLTRKLEWFVAHPEKSQAQVRDPYQLFVDNKPLQDKPLECYYDPERHHPTLSVLVQNISGSVLRTGELKVAFLFEGKYRDVYIVSKNIAKADIPTGERQVLFGELPDLLPGESHEVVVGWANEDGFQDNVPVKIRVYSSLGPRDFGTVVRAKT